MKKLCPRCKSPQKFVRRKKDVGNNEIEVFIQCNICRWRLVVTRDNVAKIHHDEEIQKLRIKAENDPQLKKVIRRKLKKYE